jgi:DNA-binding LacI/PurR family transcriptional regulator
MKQDEQMTDAVNRHAARPLYRQVSDRLMQDISSGYYEPGSRLPTEDALCVRFGVSRFPLRQALKILSDEGLIERIPGRGTYVVQIHEQQASGTGGSPVGLMLPGLSGDYTRDIARGFIQSAAACGRAAMVAISGDADEEERSIGRLLAAGAAGLVIFPCSEKIIGRLSFLRQSGVASVLIDRHMGMQDVDFVETDNVSGGFMAARHMAHHGYRSVLFCGDSLQVSSVQERLAGFQRGVAQYGLSWLTLSGTGAIQDRLPEMTGGLDFSLDSCLLHFDKYMDHQPIAIFCENDSCALQLSARLRERGLTIGDAIGIIGFDNESAGRHHQPPLTTIAQNGWLIGDTAARIMFESLTGVRKAIVRHVLPTQIIVRRSCGEESNP